MTWFSALSILSSEEKDGSLNNKTYWKRAARGLPQVSSFVYKNRQQILCDSVMHNSRLSFKSFYQIKKCVFVRTCADSGAWPNSF